MADITISHDRVSGTEVHGSVKGDGVYQVLRGLHGHWRARNGRIYLLQTRERPAKGHMISAAARALREAGHTVTVETDHAARTAEEVAAAEAGRAERAEARTERFAGYAAGAHASAAGKFTQAQRMGDAIPFGQPILIGHHSEGRDRRYREKINRTYERSFAEMDRAGHWDRRSAAAQSTQSYRESVPVTLRRIEKLRADARRIGRAMAPKRDWHWDPKGGCPDSHPVIYQAAGARRARLQAELDDITAQITHWEGQVKAAEADGARVWRPSDFAKGDYVKHRFGWAQVLRVNPKSVTIPWGVNAMHLAVVTAGNVKDAMGGGGWTTKVTYDDVTGRKSPEEMAAALAAAGEEAPDG